MHSVLNYIGKKDIDLSKYNIDNYKVYCEPFSGSFNTGFELMETGFKGKATCPSSHSQEGADRVQTWESVTP